MSGPLVLAVPSKGRLKDQTESWLADCGLALRLSGGARGYTAAREGIDGVEVRLASAADIAVGLAAGEIHLGVTTGAGLDRPFLRFANGESGGAISPDGRIAGAYVHGLFDRGAARATLLASLGAASTGVDHAAEVDRRLDEIAAVLHNSLDLTALERIAGL